MSCPPLLWVPERGLAPLPGILAAAACTTCAQPPPPTICCPPSKRRSQAVWTAGSDPRCTRNRTHPLDGSTAPDTRAHPGARHPGAARCPAAKYRHEPLFASLATGATAVLHAFQPNDLRHLAFAFAAAGVRNARLLGGVQQLALEQLPGWNAQTLAGLTQSMRKLGLPHAQLAEALERMGGAGRAQA